MGSLLVHHHHFDVLVPGFHNIQQCFHHHFHAIFVRKVVFVVLLKILWYLFWVSSAGMSLPLRKRTWWICIVEVGLIFCVKASYQSSNTEWTNTSSLCVLLLGLGNEFGQVFDWRIIIVVKTVRLSLDSCFVGQNSSVSCQPWICHKYVLIKLNDFFDSSSFLKFCDGSFLNISMMIPQQQESLYLW